MDDLRKEVATIPVLREIKSEKQYDAALEIYKQAKEIESNITARKKLLLDPASETVKQIKSFFKPMEDSVEVIIDEYHSALNTFANARETKRLAALEAVNDDKRLKHVETIIEKRESIGERASNTMRLKKVVIDNEDKIPKRFFVLDVVALRKALINEEKIDGAHLEEELTVTI